MAGSHTRLSDAPAQAEARHEDAVRDLHDEVGGEWLPCQLCDGRYGTDKAVLIAGKVRCLSQTEGRAVAQDGLVENLASDKPRYRQA